MSSDHLLISMIVSVLLFCILTLFIYRAWGRDVKQTKVQKLALEKLQADLSKNQSGLEHEKIERNQFEKQLLEVKQQLDSVIQERTTDRTAYQGLFDKLETQMKQKDSELIEKDKKIDQLQAMLPTHPKEAEVPVPGEGAPPTETPPQPPPPEPDHTEEPSAQEPPQEQHG